MSWGRGVKNFADLNLNFDVFIGNNFHFDANNF